MINGIGASPGISIGKVLKLVKENLIVEKRFSDDIDAELSRLESALEMTRSDLRQLIEQTIVNIGEEEANIFEAHINMVNDPEVLGQVKKQISSEKVNAEWAVKQVFNDFIQLFRDMDNDYMRERAADLCDVYERIIRNLLGIKKLDLTKLSESVILVADDLTPSDTASMDRERVIGFLTNVGGKTSHTAIMARTLEIPAIVGLSNVTEDIADGDYVAFDGESGEVVVNPSEDMLNDFRVRQNRYLARKTELDIFRNKVSITMDGREVELFGNIGTPDDVTSLLNNDAEGVGLYRTEFLFMNRSELPNEVEQFTAYKTVLESMRQKTCIIRTLDIGGDKELSYLKIDKEMNPFLGYRAIRLCLDQTDIFKVQLRALLRASTYGKLKIMFPMISSLEELLLAKSLLQQAKSELVTEGVSVSDDIEIGMMIEVPAAALISDVLAKHVDFFSIGTNDLVQYTCAVDRMNQRIHNLYTPLNPGVIRLIKMVIDNAHKEGKKVGMCGEMAGDKRYVPLLLGLGLDEFSMSPISILEARKQIREMTYGDAKEIAKQVLSLDSAESIERFIC